MKKTALSLVACIVMLGCNDKPELTPSGAIGLSVFPNPTSGPAEASVLNNSGQPCKLLVFNPEGQKILEFSSLRDHNG
jgi:hypothetical protein